MQHLAYAKYLIESAKFDGGSYNVFVIYDPKVRVIMSQSIINKIINHFVAKHILLKNFEKCLNDRNCATRKNKGYDYAIKLLKKDIEYFKRYDEFFKIRYK